MTILNSSRLVFNGHFIDQREQVVCLRSILDPLDPIRRINFEWMNKCVFVCVCVCVCVFSAAHYKIYLLSVSWPTVQWQPADLKFHSRTSFMAVCWVRYCAASQRTRAPSFSALRKCKNSLLQQTRPLRH